MKYIILIVILCLVTLFGCTSNGVIETTGNLVNDELNIDLISANSKLTDFYDKPSVILFGGTFCSHCKSAIPVFKEKIYDVYSQEINIWINVVDKGTFDIESIPQGYNPNLVFNDITNTKCEYVPSWIVLDEVGTVVTSSCGGEKELSDMLKSIEDLI